MYVKQFCLFLLLPVICVVRADTDTIVDAAVQSEERNASKDVLHLAKTCSSDSDCHHLGRCVATGVGKLCKCRKGTSGELCERVDECVDNPVKCGTRDDASCVYDNEKEAAVCRCDNESKTYVEDEERCMSPCKNYYDCGQYGSCYHRIGNESFCACELGTSGDYCEIIDQCENKAVDCGQDDNNATCVLGGKGNAYCKCDDTRKGFDYEEKICKDCSGCGENAYTSGRCSYKDGIRRCSCKTRYYSSEKGRCEDCKCGQQYYGCKFENGTKICQCWSGYANKDGLCEKCDCGSGPGLSRCEFKDGKKVCACKEGYYLSGKNGPCQKSCNATTPCANGGKCVQNVCNCLKGTSGELCKTVDECKGYAKCGSAQCLFNVTSKEAYCSCQGSMVFDEYYKSCKVCDCGTSSKNCTFVRGKKTCECLGLYKDRNGKCTPCYCSAGPQNYDGCKFDEEGEMKCDCLKGSAQFGKSCKTCDCGDHGKCSFNSWGYKICTCDKGYIEVDEKCKECDCGENGKCSVDYFGTKKCSCNSGYKEYQGTCKSCNCGFGVNCDFNKYGDTICGCNSGYGMKNGQCTPCDCEPGTSCTFTSGGYYGRDTKVCDCPKGYADNSGRCRVCDCEAPGSNCSFSLSFMKCQCPKGYTEENKGFSFLDKICKDIDECRNSYACPRSTTKCVNLPGSYECVCKEGYEGPDTSDAIKRDGCYGTCGAYRLRGDCMFRYRRVRAVPQAVRRRRCDVRQHDRQLQVRVCEGIPVQGKRGEEERVRGRFPSVENCYYYNRCRIGNDNYGTVNIHFQKMQCVVKNVCAEDRTSFMTKTKGCSVTLVPSDFNRSSSA